MQIRVLDRANGIILETIPVQEAAERVAEHLECDANEVRKGLLMGLPFRTTGCHYEISPDALAAYRAGKREAKEGNGGVGSLTNTPRPKARSFRQIEN